MKKILIGILLVVLAVAGWLYFIKGYVGITKHKAVPENLTYEARVPGMQNIRFMADPLKIRHIKVSDIIKTSGLVMGKLKGPDVNVLAISGGGANGAYGAGVLCGWTEAGNRPVFDIVTGVSTGALIAPAAFLGPSYDHVVRQIYTNVSQAQIAKQGIMEFIFGGRPSLLDTQPLRSILIEAVSDDVIKAVAAEHAKGRRLYMATTNLDARRLVIWDMGAIASSGSPGAAELFRNVMLASAAIPIAFPPVMITVEAGGHLYDEMHADGSVTTQVMGSLLVVSYGDIRRFKTNVYVIRNGKMADVPKAVPYRVWDIAGAAFETFMTWQSYGDIYRFATLAKYEKMRFYFTCIPYEFNEPKSGEFDLEYMRKLFYRGYKEELSGKNWFRLAGKSLQECGPGE